MTKIISSIFFFLFVLLAESVFAFKPQPDFMKLYLDKASYQNGDKAFVSIGISTQPTNSNLEYHLSATLNGSTQKVTAVTPAQAYLLTNPLSNANTNLLEVSLFLQDKKFVRDTIKAIAGYKQRNLEIDERLATETDTAIRNSLLNQRQRNLTFIAQAEQNLLNHRTFLEKKTATLVVQTISRKAITVPTVQITTGRPNDVYLTQEVGQFNVRIMSGVQLPDGPAEFLVEGSIQNFCPCPTLTRAVVSNQEFSFTSRAFNIDDVGEKVFEAKLFYRSKYQSERLRQAIAGVVTKQKDYIAKRNATTDTAEKEYYDLLIAELDIAKARFNDQLVSLLQPLGNPVVKAFEVRVSSEEEYGVEISGDQLVEMQEGASYQFNVVLKGQPVSDVNVVIDTDELMGFGAANFVPGEPVSLQFTSTNWNVPQIVTIKALQDQIARGENYHVPASFSVSSLDTRYLGYQVNSLDFLVNDDDVGTLIFSSAIELNEGGSGTYTVKLNSQPLGQVTLTIMSEGLTSVSPTTLTFDSTNWNANQTVSVTALQDTIDHGASHFSNISHEMTSTDPAYDNQALNYAVTIVDDDTPGFGVVESDGTTTATEGGAGDSLTIQLTSQPTGDVTVNFDTGSQIQPISSIVFTPLNWNIPQIIFVGAIDDSTYEGAHAGHILISSSGGGYSSVENRVIGVAISENDTPPAFTKVAAAGSSACGVRGGAVYCWGDNEFGQLGVGDTTMRSIATIVPSLSSNVTSIAGKSNFMCAIKNGGAYCWGRNTSGQLGNGSSTAFENSPVAVVGLSSGVSKIAPGLEHTCAIQNDQVFCWGANGPGAIGNGAQNGSYATPQLVSLPESATDVSAGYFHTCAVTVSGKVYCWGRNNRGQVGLGSGIPVLSPQLVSDIASGATAVTAAGEFTCAIVDNGAKCWGSNELGKLGIGSNSGTYYTPQDVVGLSSGVTAISNGYADTTCAIQNGIAKCWGWGLNGGLGNGEPYNSNVPVNVIGFTGAVDDISASTQFSCGVGQGKIKCWGMDMGGNLGNGNTGNQLTPQPITEPSPNIRRR